MNISNRQLSAFLAAARQSSFTRAAEQLHVTQAGLSAIIRELEVQFDCRLFERTTRSVSLTREGRALQPFAEKIIEEFDNAKQAVSTTASSIKSAIVIASTPIVASTLVPRAIQLFSARHHDIDIRVKDVAQDEIQGLVVSGEVDVGFSIFIRPATSVESVRIFSYHLVCVAPKGAIRKRRSKTSIQKVGLSELPRLRPITLPSHFLIQQFIDSYLAKADLGLAPRTVCNSMQTIMAMVASGRGLAVLPSMVMPLCKLYDVDIATIEDPQVTLPFYRISRRGHQLHSAYESFITAMRDGAMELGAF